MKNPKRIKDINNEEFGKWKKKREEMGNREYGDDHLQRYNLLDELEELNDMMHIHEKMLNKVMAYEEETGEKVIDNELYFRFRLLQDLASKMKETIYKMDLLMPQELCEDDLGGERVGWPERSE